MEYPKRHTGVNLIHRFYPEYTPTIDDWAGAYWGKKDEEGEGVDDLCVLPG